MPIDTKRLQSIIGHAQKMCTPEMDKEMNNYKNDSRPVNESYHDVPKPDYNYEDGWGDGSSFDLPSLSKKTGDFRYNEQTASKSNLPNAIKQSMLQEKIECDNSTLNNIDLSQLEVPKQRQRVNENVEYKSNSSIDYSLIKTIVNECISNYFQNNNVLGNTASISTIGLKEGTIKIVDNKGRIFKANLEYVGDSKSKKATD